MLDRNNENILKDKIALIPRKLADDIDCPWLEGENSLNKLCERFNLPIRGTIPAYREYVADPGKISSILNSMICKRFGTPFPLILLKRSVDQRSNLLIKNIASLLFISINVPTPHLWHVEEFSQ